MRIHEIYKIHKIRNSFFFVGNFFNVFAISIGSLTRIEQIIVDVHQGILGLSHRLIQFQQLLTPRDTSDVTNTGIESLDVLRHCEKKLLKMIHLSQNKNDFESSLSSSFTARHNVTPLNLTNQEVGLPI